MRVSELVQRTDLERVTVQRSEAGDPVTTLDKEINQLIHRMLPQEGEGWLSEETRDDLHRLALQRVWVVDPIDGTREFVQKIPEWCVSICLVEDNEAVAGGVLNPSTGEMFLGSRETGLEILHLEPAGDCRTPKGDQCVLVSRREHTEGKWSRFGSTPLNILPVGSIAYRLARVAAGYAAATCTFEPRSEWDVAAGVALVEASGGSVHTADGEKIRFNAEVPKLKSFFAFAKGCPSTIQELLGATA